MSGRKSLAERLLGTPPPPMTPLFGDAIGRWHAWFAWHPVKTVDGQWCWLIYVARQLCQTKLHLPGPIMQWFRYQVLRP